MKISTSLQQSNSISISEVRDLIVKQKQADKADKKKAKEEKKKKGK